VSLQQSPSCPAGEQRPGGEEEGRRFRQPAPSPDTPAQGQAPASCQDGELPLVSLCRGGHLLRALGWRSLALSQGEGSLCLSPESSPAKPHFSGPKSSFSWPQPVCFFPQPCVSLSHFTALHSFPRRGREREVLSSAAGVQGQDAWEWLRAASGQVQLGTRIRFCTERAAGRWDRLPERRSVPPACPCPGALWAVPSMLCCQAGPALPPQRKLPALPCPQGHREHPAHPVEFITTSPGSRAGTGRRESGPSGSQ